MSDYMFMLDSHLNSEQSRALAGVREAAEKDHLNVFLSGGAMRDMMGGFPIRDLDFTVEGGNLKLFRTIAQNMGAEILDVDDARKSVELRFSGNVTGSIGMARQERYGKPGAKPQIQPATIHDDLRGRDFTVNAIALSLSKASRGLLLDPTNGLGDLSRKELRAVSNYTLYDDPARILRMIRLRTRLGFTADERTLNQYKNVREATLETKISPASWARELRQIAAEPLAGDILKALEDENLLQLISPALTGPKLNLAGFARLQKARLSVPYGMDIKANSSALFFFLFFEKLTPRERSALMATVGLSKEITDAASRLESRATKLERELAAAKLTRPSALYAMLSNVPGEILLFLLARSSQRIVLDRIKNYLQKYLPAALEITEQDVLNQGGEPGTPKGDKLREKLIATRLDAKPKKVVVEEPPPPPANNSGRRSISLAR